LGQSLSLDERISELLLQANVLGVLGSFTCDYRESECLCTAFYLCQRLPLSLRNVFCAFLSLKLSEPINGTRNATSLFHRLFGQQNVSSEYVHRLVSTIEWALFILGHHARASKKRGMEKNISQNS
jgi:hypothetical protein